MKKNTRFAFNAYLQQLARLNGVAVEELSSKFTVEPSVQQTLEDQIQQSAAFLTLINVTPVTEQSGQLLGLGVGSTIAGTTDTTAKEREPVDPTLMVDVEYKCEQTNFDTVLTYAKLDLWRNNRRYVGEWVCSNSINYFWRSETTYYPVGSGAVWGKSGG